MNDMMMKYYLDALKANPNDPDNHSNIGYLCFQFGRYDQAIKYYDQAIKLKPKDPFYQLNKGNTLLSMG